ncbi:MAG: sigma-70 family RNA polymerase sigma factor [Blastocatellia bacterium]
MNPGLPELTTTMPNADRPNADRNDLIEQHQPYVRALAVEIARTLPSHIEIDELIACGNLGLVEAAERYDPRYRVSFHTFAWYRIRGAIFDALRQMGPLSRGEYATLRKSAALNEILQTSADDALGHDPAGRRGVDDDIADAQATIDVMIPVFLLSLEAEDAPDVPDRRPSRLEEMEHEEMVRLTREMVEDLPEDDRRLVNDIYFGKYNIVEYAKKIGVTKSWASRLHARAVRRLRDLMIDRGLLSSDLK